MTPGRFVVLANPGAREGRVIPRLQAALRTAGDLGKRVEVATVTTTAEARALLAALAPADTPVIAGGDGTINMVVTALRAEGLAHRPLGLLPFGTGNAVAHALGVGTVTAALAALAAGRHRRIDIIAVESHAFQVAVGSVSAGFEANALRPSGRQHTWSRAWGVAGGVLGSATRITGGVTIELDGEPFVSADERFYNAGVYLLPCYGFGFRVLPGAQLDDGVAEAAAWPGPASYWPSYFRGIRTGDGRCAGARLRQWRHARFIHDGPIQIDGECTAGGVLALTVEPGALCLIGP